MASIPGGQFTFSAAHGAVNTVITPDGSSLPPPIAGEFNLEVVTSPQGTNYPLPPGYQGVVLLSDGGHNLDLLHGNIDLGVTGTGDDTVQGGDGNDTIQGGIGAETIYGGEGNDLLIGGTGPDIIYGGTDNDTINGGTGPETITGGSGNDVINAGTGADSIWGGSGSDTINGGTGPDTLYGGIGNDTINGGTGPDTIAGGSGNNDIYTGTGSDLIQDTASGSHDTVFGFDNNDAISFTGENPLSVQHVVATAQEQHGNTTLTLPDGSTITLVGITHLDSGFFH